jgi:hypothetical protein
MSELVGYPDALPLQLAQNLVDLPLSSPQLVEW